MYLISFSYNRKNVFWRHLKQKSSDPTSLLKSELNQQAAFVYNQIRDFASRIVLLSKILNSRKLNNEHIRNEDLKTSVGTGKEADNRQTL